MDRLFLDANVLFSAAYREDAGLTILWRLPQVILLSSAYAVEEARVNLQTSVQHERLTTLVGSIQIMRGISSTPMPSGVRLPDKDTPILLSAIAGGATHLVTGDKAHFGKYFGKTVAGIRIVAPADFLRSRTS